VAGRDLAWGCFKSVCRPPALWKSGASNSLLAALRTRATVRNTGAVGVWVRRVDAAFNRASHCASWSGEVPLALRGAEVRAGNKTGARRLADQQKDGDACCHESGDEADSLERSHFRKPNERASWLCRLTFELSRPRRRDGLPVRRMMDHGRCAGKTACRSGSALERGVRRRCAAWPTAGLTKHQALGGHWTHVKRRSRSGCLGRRLRSARAWIRLWAQGRCVGDGPRTGEAPKRQGVGSPAQRLDLAAGTECGWLAQARGDRATSGASARLFKSLAEARALCSRPMAAEQWSEHRWPVFAPPNVRAKPTAEAGRLARAAHDGPRALRGQDGVP
jgi:hypothetical protein